MGKEIVRQLWNMPEPRSQYMEDGCECLDIDHMVERIVVFSRGEKAQYDMSKGPFEIPRCLPPRTVYAGRGHIRELGIF